MPSCSWLPIIRCCAIAKAHEMTEPVAAQSCLHVMTVVHHIPWKACLYMAAPPSACSSNKLKCHACSRLVPEFRLQHAREWHPSAGVTWHSPQLLICAQEQGTLALAEGLCMRLLDYGASSKERARALLREIRSLQVPFTHIERRDKTLPSPLALKEDLKNLLLRYMSDRL